MPAATRAPVPAYASLLRIALSGRLVRIYVFSFLALHTVLATVLTFPLSPSRWLWVPLRLFWPQLILCSAAAFVLGLLPLLVADRRAITRLATSASAGGSSPLALITSLGSSPSSLTLSVLRLSYALVFSIAYATALSLANVTTSPTYRDSWAPYIPSYFARNTAGGGGSGTVVTSSRQHGAHQGSGAHAAYVHAQTRPNERYIFLVISAVTTSTLLPLVFARTSAQGIARRAGDAAVLLFHPLDLHSTLTSRLNSAAFPRLRPAATGPVEPGKEPAQLFFTHTLVALLLPLTAYLPIYALIRRHLYRSLLLLIIRLTAGDTRTAAQTLSGATRHSTLALSAASKLRYYLIPSLRGGVFSFLFNIELLLRPALLSAAVFAVAELSLSLARIYASQPVIVSGYANPQAPASTTQPAGPAVTKDSYTAPTQCLVAGVVENGSKYLKNPGAAGNDLFVLHLAIAELALLASSPDGARRRALFNEFGSAGASSRASLGLDTLGGYGPALQPDRDSAWAQVAKTGIQLLKAETAAVRERSAPLKPASATTAKAITGPSSESKLSRPSFGRDAFVSLVPQPGKDAPPSVLKPAAPKSVWDRLAEEVSATGAGKPASGGADAGNASQGTVTNTLIRPAATSTAKATGVVSAAVAVAGSVLRLLLPPTAPAPAPAPAQPSAESNALQRRVEPVPAPVTPLEAVTALVQALQRNVEAAAQKLDQLVPRSSREAVVKRVQAAVPGPAAATAAASGNRAATTEAVLKLLLPVSPQTLGRLSPLVRAELQAASTATSLAHVLPAHPALAVWTAQALTDLAAASVSEDEYGCVQRASRVSARARRLKEQQVGGGGASGGAEAREVEAGVSDLMEALLELWEAVDAAVQHERRRTGAARDGNGDGDVVAMWEAGVQDLVLLPLRRAVGELWATFGRFQSEVGFGDSEEDAARWRARIEAVLHVSGE